MSTPGKRQVGGIKSAPSAKGTRKTMESRLYADQVRLAKESKITIDRLDRYALALQAQYPDKDWAEDIIPLALQRLNQMSKLLSGVHPAELAFMVQNGRRWKPGEWVTLTTAALIFDSRHLGDG
jgi:hypothetical protein